MNIKTILNHLFGKVMKDGKRIPNTRIMVFGTRIFFEDYLLPDDTIVCTDWADFISMRMRGKYNHVEFLSESEIKKMVSEEKLYNYMERKYDMKKFDLVVSNPPYNKDLHLQIIDELTKIANKVVCVHPANWFIDQLIDFKGKTKYGKYKKEIEPHIEKVQRILTHEEAAKIFNIESNELMIAVYSHEITGFKKEPDDMVYRILKSPKKYTDYLNRQKTDYFLPVAKFHWTAGDTISFAPFSLLLSSDGKYAKSGWKKGLHDTYEIFYFDTQLELENCRAMLNSDWYKEMLGKYFIGKRLCPKLIPMPNNFKTKITIEDVLPIA